MKIIGDYRNNFDRIGVGPPRAYYIPFSESVEFAFKNHILDRKASDILWL